MKTLFSILLASVCLIADAQEIMFSNTPFKEGEEHLNTTKLDFVDTEPIYGLVIVPKGRVYHEFDGYSSNIRVGTEYGCNANSTYVVRGDNAYIYMDINPEDSHISDTHADEWAGCFKRATEQWGKFVVLFKDDELGVQAKIKVKKTKDFSYWENRADQLSELILKLEEKRDEELSDLRAINNTPPRYHNAPFVQFEMPELSKENLTKALLKAPWINGGEVINIAGYDDRPSREWQIITHRYTGNILKRETVKLGAIYKKKDGWCYYTSVHFYQQYTGNGQYGALQVSPCVQCIESKILCDNLK